MMVPWASMTALLAKFSEAIRMIKVALPLQLILDGSIYFWVLLT